MSRPELNRYKDQSSRMLPEDNSALYAKGPAIDLAADAPRTSEQQAAKMYIGAPLD
jgi:hypothetical protein